MIPTIQEIRDQIIADIETERGQSTPMLQKAAFRILAYGISGALYLLYRFTDWVETQIFTQNMDRDRLILRGAEYGLSPTAATKWQGTLTLTGVDTTIVPAGTLFQYSGMVYQTTAGVTISGATAAAAESLEAGAELDRDVNDELEIVTPIAGLDSTATVASKTQSGVDAESTSSFRSKILEHQRRKPQGGSIADFVAWTREVAGVVKAFAFRTGSGEVTVYPLMGTGSTDRLPDAGELTTVQTYVDSVSRKPLTADVLAAAMSVTDFDINISTMNPDTSAIRTAVEAGIEEYLLGRFPLQYPDEENPTNLISTAEIHKIAFDAGASQIDLEMEEAGTGTPISGYTLSDGELAGLGVITWPS